MKENIGSDMVHDLYNIEIKNCFIKITYKSHHFSYDS